MAQHTNSEDSLVPEQAQEPFASARDSPERLRFEIWWPFVFLVDAYCSLALPHSVGWVFASSSLFCTCVAIRMTWKRSRTPWAVLAAIIYIVVLAVLQAVIVINVVYWSVESALGVQQWHAVITLARGGSYSVASAGAGLQCFTHVSC